MIARARVAAFDVLDAVTAGRADPPGALAQSPEKLHAGPDRAPPPVPAAAVVDDAVELTRRVKKRSASGFVNAVLRSISRKRAALLLPPRPADVADRAAALDYLAISLSHPRWLVSRWYDRLGFE